MTLTDFLLARIAEDEAQAREAIAKRDAITYTHPPVVPDMELVAFEDIGVPAVIVGPERVLAECEAKRRIVGLHGGDYDGECQSPAHLDGACRTLRALALPYADHSDYREEWKP